MDSNHSLSGHRQSIGEHIGSRPRTALVVGFVLVAIVLAETLLFFEQTWPSIWIHGLALLGAALLLGRVEDAAPVQALALVPLFRMVNLGMPVFFQLTVYWLPLVYGPLIPALVYVDRARPDLSIPAGWRRGLLLTPVAIVGGWLLAEVEQVIIQTGPLIPEWNLLQVLLITVVMVGFVGFVEEYLFRGIVQETFVQRLGRWPGILLASALFGLMHSGYGLPGEVLFAGVIGFVFGVCYEYLDSLVFVTVFHGILNVFLFAYLPIHGSVLFP